MVKTRGGQSQAVKRGSSYLETQSPQKRQKTVSASHEPPSTLELESSPH